jgi:anti-sigma B factor antagonist
MKKNCDPSEKYCAATENCDDSVRLLWYDKRKNTSIKQTGGPNMLNVTKTVENGQGTISLEGRLDTMSAPELELIVRDTIPGLTALTLDFEKLDYISSAGLRVLLSAQKQMNHQGSMTLTNVNPAILEIFEVTGFTDILTIA